MWIREVKYKKFANNEGRLYAKKQCKSTGEKAASEMLVKLIPDHYQSPANVLQQKETLKKTRTDLIVVADAAVNVKIEKTTTTKTTSSKVFFYPQYLNMWHDLV